jgi:hypothetical protein
MTLTPSFGSNSLNQRQKKNLHQLPLPEDGRLKVFVLTESPDILGAKAKLKSENRRRSGESVSSLPDVSDHSDHLSVSSVPDLSALSPYSFTSTSPAPSSKRSSYCTAPDGWADPENASPRFLVLEGAEDNDLEDIFSSTLSLREPVVEDRSVESIDMPYFDYFLLRMPQLMSFVDLFPSVAQDVFARSIDHAALRHSILSISTMLATGDQPLDMLPSRHYHHKQQALQLLQTSLGGSPRDLTENDAIAIFLLLWLDFNAGSSVSATHHLRGLYQVLQQVQTNTRESTAGFGGVSALLMLVWRSAYRYIIQATSLICVEWKRFFQPHFTKAAPFSLPSLLVKPHSIAGGYPLLPIRGSHPRQNGLWQSSLSTTWPTEALFLLVSQIKIEKTIQKP